MYLVISLLFCFLWVRFYQFLIIAYLFTLNPDKAGTTVCSINILSIIGRKSIELVLLFLVPLKCRVLYQLFMDFRYAFIKGVAT